MLALPHDEVQDNAQVWEYTVLATNASYDIAAIVFGYTTGTYDAAKAPQPGTSGQPGQQHQQDELLGRESRHPTTLTNSGWRSRLPTIPG